MPRKSCNYPDLEHMVEKADGLIYGRIGQSISRLVDATILRDTLLPVFQETPEFGRSVSQ